MAGRPTLAAPRMMTREGAVCPADPLFMEQNMCSRCEWRAAAREWFVALVCYSLVIAPFGCRLPSFAPLDDLPGSANPGGTGEPTAGLFIESDFTTSHLLGGRNAGGDSFFVYGTRDSQGNLQEIQSILIRTADGQETFLAFESGRPVHARGPDGSYVHVTYSEISLDRLKAAAELYNAATGEKQIYPVEIDLRQTATQVAELVHSITGRELEVLTEDQARAGAGGTTRRLDAPAGENGHLTCYPEKLSGLERVRITIFSPLFGIFVLPLVALVALTSVILGQILVAMYAVVAVTVQAVLLMVFAPLFLIGELLGRAIVRIELVPLAAIFDRIPPPPIVLLA